MTSVAGWKVIKIRVTTTGNLVNADWAVTNFQLDNPVNLRGDRKNGDTSGSTWSLKLSYYTLISYTLDIS